MSGNKIGFNEITEIGFNGNYGADLNSRLKAINDNFDKIAKADYMKGVDGDDVRVLNAGFAENDSGNPLEGNGYLYYNGGETHITKKDLYKSIHDCIAGLASTEEKKPINGISWDSGLLENNSIMIIADEENGNYYLKSSLYFVYNDPRFANPTEDAKYGSLKNLSCVVTYDGEKWVASQPFPKIYYSVEANDFCWEINGQPTKLIARGPQGLSGQNYPVWLCASSVNNIKELTQDEQKIDNTISIQVEGIYRLEGTEYNYITPPTEKIPDDEEGKQKWEENKQKWERIIDKEEFKNNMALCIVHDVKDEENNKLIKLYCGYLYKQENNLYIYSSQNSAIDTIIGHKTLYSLLKSNSPGNTIQNSLFIPTGHVNIDGSLSGKKIYSIYGLNETETGQTYHTFNIGVSMVSKDDGKTLTPQYGRTKLNLWSSEMNFNMSDGAALQINSDKININRNLISSHDKNGKPQRYIQMKLPESYLTFDSYTQIQLSDRLSPIDAAMNPEACANRLSFYNPDLVDIEYSADRGETWKDCFTDPETGKMDQDSAYKIKTKLLTTGFKDILSNLYLGKKFNTNGTFTNKDKLRVSIYIRPGEFYGRLDKINLYTAFRPIGNLQMKCDVHLYKAVMPYNASSSDSIDSYYVNTNRKDFYSEDSDTNIYFGWDVTTIPYNNLIGEPGWNSMPINGYTIGGYNNVSDGGYKFLNNRVYKIVFEYSLTGESNLSTPVARVCGIRLFGSSWYVVKDKNGNTNALANYNSICSWDENGAAIFPSGVSNQFKITYKELKTLADERKLVSGTKYRITDYIPKFNGEDIKSGEHQFDIIVEAVDNKTLSEKANAVLHDGDTYFKNSKLNQWELKYSLNTSGFDWVADDDPGVVYYMKDEFDNEAPYDFKNMMFKIDKYDDFINNPNDYDLYNDNLNWLHSLRHILYNFTNYYGKAWYSLFENNDNKEYSSFDKYFYENWIIKYRNLTPIISDVSLDETEKLERIINTGNNYWKRYWDVILGMNKKYGKNSEDGFSWEWYENRTNFGGLFSMDFIQRIPVYVYTFSDINITNLQIRGIDYPNIISVSEVLKEEENKINENNYNTSILYAYNLNMDTTSPDKSLLIIDYKIDILGDSTILNTKCTNNIINHNNNNILRRNVFLNLCPEIYNFIYSNNTIDISYIDYIDYSPRCNCFRNIIFSGSDNYFGPMCQNNKLIRSEKNIFQCGCSNNNLQRSIKNYFAFNCNNNTLGEGCLKNYFNDFCMDNKLLGTKFIIINNKPIINYNNLYGILRILDKQDINIKDMNTNLYAPQSNVLKSHSSNNTICRGVHFNNIDEDNRLFMEITTTES